MNTVFDKFNNMFDVAGLKSDIESAASKTGDFVEVPFGDYEVTITKLELGETGVNSKNPGMPMMKVWFKILTGEFKGQLIFMNQMVNSGFGLFKANKFLTSLESDVDILFEDFNQYGTMLDSIFSELDSVAEYHLHCSENDKHFKEYEIKERFK